MCNREISSRRVDWFFPRSSTTIRGRSPGGGVVPTPLHWRRWRNTENGRGLRLRSREVKVRSKVKIWRFDVLGPGDQDYRTWWLKLRQNVVKCMVKVWYEYKWHTKKKTSRSRSGHKRSLYVRIVIKSCDTCFMGQFRRRARKSGLKYH